MTCDELATLSQYIQAALDRAEYELIEDEEPYYGQVPQLGGVWATGKTLEECRRNLIEAIEDWVLFSPPAPYLSAIVQS